MADPQPSAVPASIRLGQWWLYLQGALIFVGLLLVGFGSGSVAAAVIIAIATLSLAAGALIPRGGGWRRFPPFAGVLYLFAPVDTLERVFLLLAGVGATVIIRSATSMVVAHANRSRVVACWLLAVAAIMGVLAVAASNKQSATGSNGGLLLGVMVLVGILDLAVVGILLYVPASQRWVSAPSRTVPGDLIRLARGLGRGLLMITTEDRVRGSGWLQCPDCKEQATQDVVDRMRFLRVLMYRVSVVWRRRDLICRKCRYRRPVTDEEMGTLQTAGRAIRHAFLVPVGLIALLIAGGVFYVGFGGTPDVLATNKISFNTINESNEGFGPISYAEPNSWNHDFLTNSETGKKFLYVHETTASGQLAFYIYRLDGDPSLADIVNEHYQDLKSPLQSPDFPTEAPKTTCMQIAGQKAASYTMTFTLSGDHSKVLGYAFKHEKVGYLIVFLGRQQASIDLLEPLSTHIIGSLKFTGSEPAPSGTPSPAPTPTPTPGATTIPTPTPSPTVSVSC